MSINSKLTFFKTAEGDPLGGCCLTPSGYSEMTRKVMQIPKNLILYFRCSFDTFISTSIMMVSLGVTLSLAFPSFVFSTQLTDLAKGRVILVLEGGYNLNSIAESYLACLHVLLGDSLQESPLIPKTKPLQSTWYLLKKVRR